VCVCVAGLVSAVSFSTVCRDAVFKKGQRNQEQGGGVGGEGWGVNGDVEVAISVINSERDQRV
jgi:hypothetical protein